MRQLKITQQITTRETASLTSYLHDISLIPLLTREEEETLPLKIQEGDEQAFKRFVEGNLRFVISVAKQYQGAGTTLGDLINVGNEGLIIAAKKFDTSRGFKFISYGVWWIRQAIMQYLTENGKAIRLPANKVAILSKIKSATTNLEQKLERVPVSNEILDEILDIESKKSRQKDFKLDIEDIEQMLYTSAPIASLDMTLGEDSETTLSDLIISKDMIDVNDTLKYEDLQKVIKKVFKLRLSQREQDIMIANFGLFGNKTESLEEIGEKFELTRERVRQIREKACRKLRFQETAKEIKQYI